jgi:hypothetical protein
MLQTVNKFNFLGYILSYQGEVDISCEISKYTKTMEVTNNALKPSLVQRNIGLCLYKTSTVPIVCYESRTWAIRKQIINRTATCEIKFMRRLGGYTKWDHKRKNILDKIKIKRMLNYMQNYHRKWKEHVNRKNTEESQNKFYIIGQEDKHQSDVT